MSVAGVAGAAALVVALVDWWSVARERTRVEYVAKPAVLLLLIVAAVSLDPADPTVRAWFVAGLVASLVGDVVLMLPRGPFVAGLGAFLVAHLCYIGGLVADGPSAGAAVLGLLVAGAGVAVLGPGLLRGVARTDGALVGPVVAYIAAIGAMVVLAVATGDLVAAVGAVLFFASDGILGWTRFVRRFPGDRVAVHVTYHLGQAMLVAWLAS
jgi:uncharacterized membrane protein YhhN